MAKRGAANAANPGEHGTDTESQRAAREYLSDLQAIRATGAGVPETSYYPALANLFNAVGKTLKPRVRCVMTLRNLGAGLPDGGLFTAEQFQRTSDHAPKAGELPARGAIEAKGTKPEVEAIAASRQVKEYLSRYGIVIVSNLRGFLIVERGANHHPVERESFSIADDEADFWRNKVAHPRATAEDLGDQFIEFMKRACLHAAPLVNPKDVAWFLASYARDALVRVERRKELPALQAVRSALEESLGMKFTEDKGEHFFRSTLVQTLFYGVFSAWVTWHKSNPGPRARFDWQKAEWSLHVPFVRTLYEEVAKPTRLGQLGLVEVLDWAAGVLSRVDRDEFFRRFEDEHAVQYFYEPFLEAYDPKLRKELGVWYTPREIVRYQVARVDTVLREELELPDGLADPKVIILDPCCGTGTYLVEVLHRIAGTLRGKGGDALVASDLKQAAMNRVFGFEILPAPFVVSHLQLGLMLQAEGAPLSHKRNERVGVYLTNALTGWEPPQGVKATLPLPYPELQEERDAAEQVKRDKRILVILGNPPYNAFAGVSPEEEQGLVEPYKKDLNKPASTGGWGIKKFNLDDLYVRFFRLAERRIAEMTGQGVVSFISNFSYLGDPSFVVMRQRFLAEFDKLWLDCMNGDSRETGKLTPSGEPDPSVFSTEYNRAGIRVGTAVCVMVRKPTQQKKPTVRFRHFWGGNKRADLLESLNAKRFDAAYTDADPQPGNRFSFRPANVTDDYQSFARISDFAVARSDGLFEKRAGALIDIDRDSLETRMRDYFDADLSWDEYKARQTALTRNAARFDAKSARAKVVKAESFAPDRLQRYVIRPFETRWCYYTPVRPIWNEPRPILWQNLPCAGGFIVSRLKTGKSPRGSPIFFTRLLVDGQVISVNPSAFPIMLAATSEQQSAALFGTEKPHANLSNGARAYLVRLGIRDPDADAETAGLIWMHVLAIGYSPAYLTENADGIRRDWPRIPLPDSRKALEASGSLGEGLAALLDTEGDVPGVTCGKIPPALKRIGLVSRVGGGGLDPGAGDLAVTAGWGHGGKEGVTMPGKGRWVERRYDEDEARGIEAEATARGMSGKEAAKLLGEQTRDVYLNDKAYWRNIPAAVWEYHIGGYQVIKKWLSYREEGILGRALKPEEAREVMDMARRIAGIILLQPKLDENYRQVKASAFEWAGTSSQ